MQIKPLVSRMALGAVLLASGAALPTMAIAHDEWSRDYRGYDQRGYEDRDGDRFHREYWQHPDRYVREPRYSRRPSDDDYVYYAPTYWYPQPAPEPHVYYSPAYGYSQSAPGITFIYRGR